MKKKIIDSEMEIIDRCVTLLDALGSEGRRRASYYLKERYSTSIEDVTTTKQWKWKAEYES